MIMKTLLFLLALSVSATAQIEKLMKQGANVTVDNERITFVPVKFEPCSLVWQLKYKKFSREVALELADLDAPRFRIDPVEDQSGIFELKLYTLSDRDLIREQTIYPNDSRTDLTHKSRHVLLMKNQSVAEKLKQAFAAETAKCVGGGGTAQ